MSTIPYHPQLSLGSIVAQNLLTKVKEVSKNEANIQTLEDNLNIAIEAKRSLDLTIQDLLTMEISEDTDQMKTIVNKSKELEKTILDNAKQLAEAKVSGLKQAVDDKKALNAIVTSDIESPIDFNRSSIKKMPLSSDSIKMDAQYFSFSENKQDANNTIGAIKDYIAASTSVLGTKKSVEMTNAGTAQVTKQLQNHSLAGTLVITATCTHKDAVLFAPFILDVDKGIRVWNEIAPDDKRIKMDDVQELQKIAKEQGTKDETKLNLISGANYGSSFVGMVHVLRSESTVTNQEMLSAAASLQAQMEAGSWFAHSSGGFGINSTFANDVKKLLSTQQIYSHISMITMGSIPDIKASAVKLAVKEFANFDPAKMMEQLATVANATTAAQSTVQESAQAARTGSQMLQIRASEIKSVMLGLGEIDDGTNKMLDINTLMTAFEDYVNKALAGNIGLPITYHLKPITRAQLAQMWVAKYYPNQYLTISGDDNQPSGNQPAAQAAAQLAAQPAAQPAAQQA